MYDIITWSSHVQCKETNDDGRKVNKEKEKHDRTQRRRRAALAHHTMMVYDDYDGDVTL